MHWGRVSDRQCRNFGQTIVLVDWATISFCDDLDCTHQSSETTAELGHCDCNKDCYLCIKNFLSQLTSSKQKTWCLFCSRLRSNSQWRSPSWTLLSSVWPIDCLFSNANSAWGIISSWRINPTKVAFSSSVLKQRNRECIELENSEEQCSRTFCLLGIQTSETDILLSTCYPAESGL